MTIASRPLRSLVVAAALAAGLATGLSGCSLLPGGDESEGCASSVASAQGSPDVAGAEAVAVQQGTVWSSSTGVSIGLVRVSCTDGAPTATVSVWRADGHTTATSITVAPLDVVEVEGGTLHVTGIEVRRSQAGDAPGSNGSMLTAWFVPAG